MPNDFFQFRQFTIQQNKSAMKVCTDACLLGAFATEEINKKELLPVEKNEENYLILDIGTGTGLLSLMIAQKTNCTIDAIEIDEHAAEQAIKNVALSPWAKRINVYHSSIQEFETLIESGSLTANSQYKYIISNPPFFNNSLSSTSNQKNLAKHTTALPYKELASAINHLLSHNGYAYIMLPFKEMLLFREEMQQFEFYPHLILSIKQTEKHNYFRSIVVFSKTKALQIEQQELTIKIHQTYSPEFVSLLKDYYLYL